MNIAPSIHVLYGCSGCVIEAFSLKSEWSRIRDGGLNTKREMLLLLITITRPVFCSFHILSTICFFSACSPSPAAGFKFRNKVLSRKSLHGLADVFVPCDEAANITCGIQKEIVNTVYTDTFLCWTGRNSLSWGGAGLIEDASHSAVFLLSGLSFGETVSWRCRLLSSWYPCFMRQVTYWNMVWVTTQWSGWVYPKVNILFKMSLDTAVLYSKLNSYTEQLEVPAESASRALCCRILDLLFVFQLCMCPALWISLDLENTAGQHETVL